MAAPRKAATAKVEETVAKTVKSAAPVKAEEVKKDAVKTEEVKKEPAKEEVKAAPAKKEAAAKKAAPAKKTAAKKTAAKRTTGKAAKLESKMHIEFGGKSITQEDLDKIGKDVWKYDLKNKVADLKSAEYYVKPEENMVYYVFNKDITGSFSI